MSLLERKKKSKRSDTLVCNKYDLKLCLTISKLKIMTWNYNLFVFPVVCKSVCIKVCVINTTQLEISILVYNFVYVVGSNHRISSFFSEWCGLSVKSLSYVGSHKGDIFHALICQCFESILKRDFRYGKLWKQNFELVDSMSLALFWVMLQTKNKKKKFTSIKLTNFYY